MQVKFWGDLGSIPSPTTGPGLYLTLKTLIESVQNRPGIRNKPKDLLEKLPRHLICPIGGKAPCIEIKHGNTRITPNMGSGLRPPGAKLSLGANFSKNNPGQPLKNGQAADREDKTGLDLPTLLSHIRRGNSQGLPFFTPARNAAKHINTLGAFKFY